MPKKSAHEFRHGYFRALGLDRAPTGEADQKRLVPAPDRAHEIQNFEIGLYRKRAIYFSALAISFAALGLLVKNGRSIEEYAQQLVP
jgi:hypothetical protein